MLQEQDRWVGCAVHLNRILVVPFD
jgi:hypothetical protein